MFVLLMVRPPGFEPGTTVDGDISRKIPSFSVSGLKLAYFSLGAV